MIKRVADKIFALLCNPKYYSDIRGDLEEIYQQLMQNHPALIAQLLYLSEVVLLMRISLLRPVFTSTQNAFLGIIRNSLVVSVRQMRKNRMHSIINVTGLSVGFACCLLISLFILDELNYDGFHKDADRIYRINVHSEIGGNLRNWALAPSSIAPALKNNLPEVELYTRIAPVARSQQSIIHDDVVYDLSMGSSPYGKVFWADSNFFEMFTFEVVAGSLDKALSDPISAVITEREAIKIFGKEDVVGRTLEFNSIGRRKITAVLKNIPTNSHLQFDYILSNKYIPAPPPNQFWSRVYIKFHPQTDLLTVQPKLDSIARDAEPDMLKNGVRMEFWPTPVKDLHLTSGLEYELTPTNDIKYIYIFSSISFFILLIATINFINLSTAQIGKRAKESGIRKVLGARKKQIIVQFLIHSILVVFLSSLVSLAIAGLCMTEFNSFTGKSLTLYALLNWKIIALLILLVLTLGILAGLYPALMFSAHGPLVAFKMYVQSGTGNHMLRKVLVVCQFFVSVTLIIATMVVVQQLTFLRNHDMGIDQDQILLLNIDNSAKASKLASFKEEIQKFNSIDKVSISSGGPGRNTNVMVMVPEGFDDGTSHRMDGIFGDFDFIKTYNLEIIAGRDFNNALVSDSLNFILNRSAIKKIGWSLDEAIGKSIEYPSNAPVQSKGGKVIGIIEDFHYASLHSAIGPIIIGIHSTNFNVLGMNHMSVKFKGNDYQNVLLQIGNIWDEMFSDQPFNVAFLDATFQKKYENESRLTKIISVFAGLAIMIACLGLFGLAIYITQSRTKEIGIRKVLGASVSAILTKLISGFVYLIIIGNVLAWPISYILLNSWLDDFAYHVELEWLIFLIAGISSLLIACATIGYQTFKAAITNPVRSLRYE